MQQQFVDIDFTINGTKLSFRLTYDPMSPVDRDVVTCMTEFGCPEPEVIHLMVRTIRCGDFVIDCGANIGFFTLIMSKLVGDSGIVLAVEPAENSLFKLKENLKINGVRNFEICNQPLWSRPETVTLHYCDHPGMTSLSGYKYTLGKKELLATTLSRWTTTPRLIKIDVEGSEEQVLRGAQRHLVAGVPYIVAELNVDALKAMGSTQESLRKYMREWGYSTFILFRGGELPCLVPEKTEIFEAKDYNGVANVLFSTVENVSNAWPQAILRKV